MSTEAVVFLQGVSATGALISALLFLRFWRESRDQLFVYFATAFALLAASWTLLGFFSPTDEARPYVYALRLVAFGLIILGMVVKNLEQRRR